MEKSVNKTLSPRKVFWKHGTCSQAMFHLLNHEFNNEKLQQEKASDMLAGGIIKKGEQCGMLWGAALAAGAEAYRLHQDKNTSIAASVEAAKYLAESFQKRTKTVNCRDIAKVDWENKLQLTLYMLKTMACGMVFSHCFNLIVKWTPEAIEAARKGLNETAKPAIPCMSCATEVIGRMGATEEESITVAGLAGGIGLTGNACGALGAAIWFKMLQWEKGNPGKSQSMFSNPDAKKILANFSEETGNEMRCEKITERRFKSITEHTEYLQSGGCKKIMEALVNA